MTAAGEHGAEATFVRFGVRRVEPDCFRCGLVRGGELFGNREQVAGNVGVGLEMGGLELDDGPASQSDLGEFGDGLVMGLANVGRS